MVGDVRLCMEGAQDEHGGGPADVGEEMKDLQHQLIAWRGEYDQDRDDPG